MSVIQSARFYKCPEARKHRHRFLCSNIYIYISSPKPFSKIIFIPRAQRRWKKHSLIHVYCNISPRMLKRRMRKMFHLWHLDRWQILIDRIANIQYCASLSCPTLCHCVFNIDILHYPAYICIYIITWPTIWTMYKNIIQLTDPVCANELMSNFNAARQLNAFGTLCGGHR